MLAIIWLFFSAGVSKNLKDNCTVCYGVRSAMELDTELGKCVDFVGIDVIANVLSVCVCRNDSLTLTR